MSSPIARRRSTTASHGSSEPFLPRQASHRLLNGIVAQEGSPAEICVGLAGGSRTPGLYRITRWTHSAASRAPRANADGKREPLALELSAQGLHQGVISRQAISQVQRDPIHRLV